MPCASRRRIMTGARSRRSPWRRTRCRMPCNTPAASAPLRSASPWSSELNWIDRVASGILLLAPVVFIAHQVAPILLVLQLVAGLLLLGDPHRRPCRDLAGRARCQLHQGTAGDRSAAAILASARSPRRPQCASRRGLYLCRGGARHAARRDAVVAHAQILRPDGPPSRLEDRLEQSPPAGSPPWRAGCAPAPLPSPDRPDRVWSSR